MGIVGVVIIVRVGGRQEIRLYRARRTLSKWKFPWNPLFPHSPWTGHDFRFFLILLMCLPRNKEAEKTAPRWALTRFLPSFESSSRWLSVGITFLLVNLASFMHGRALRNSATGLVKGCSRWKCDDDFLLASFPFWENCRNRTILWKNVLFYL